MLHRGFVEAESSGIRGWGAQRSQLRRGSGPSMVKRTFDEDLALFERQVRDELEHRVRVPQGILARASSSGPVS